MIRLQLQKLLLRNAGTKHDFNSVSRSLRTTTFIPVIYSRAMFSNHVWIMVVCIVIAGGASFNDLK